MGHEWDRDECICSFAKTYLDTSVLEKMKNQGMQESCEFEIVEKKAKENNNTASCFNLEKDYRIFACILNSAKTNEECETYVKRLFTDPNRKVAFGPSMEYAIGECLKRN